MTAGSPLRTGGRAEEPADPRVQAVLEVLRGVPSSEVARRRSLDAGMLHRWVRDFVAAGAAQVTNRPDPDASRQRDRFLAAFSHEMRSPLATAHGWATMLLDGDVPERAVLDGVRRLHDALLVLHDRTVDVEMLASASLGRLRVRPRPTTLGELAAEAVPPAGDDRPGLLVAPGADTTRLEVDPALASRVLRDLWRAAHLDPAPVSVCLDHARVGPWHELRVVRTGPPLPVPRLQALFEPFDLNDDGTGVTIGLYLARALAVSHGGWIGAEQGDGRTTLWVRFPLDPAASTADTAQDGDAAPDQEDLR